MDNKSVDRKLAKAQLFRGSEYACLSHFQTRTFLCSSSRWTVSPARIMVSSQRKTTDGSRNNRCRMFSSTSKARD